MLFLEAIRKHIDEEIINLTNKEVSYRLSLSKKKEIQDE